MLKIKSKAILAFTGLMVAAFVLLGAYSASADLVTLPAAGVSKASSAENIKNLQTFLNWNLGSAITPLVVDGVYGAKTTAAIRMFQSNNGLTADGVFGKMSTAKAMALQANMSGGTYPAGCASASGYSSTTGMPCAGGSYPAGCTSAMGFSSTTGAPCNGPVGTLPAGCTSASGFSVTTGQACTSTTVSTGTNGYLSDLASDSSNRVSTVYESEQDKVVAGFRATARLSSQTVNRVRVEMRNTDTGGSSVNLAKYISSASLWYGSTKLATMAVAQADRSTSSDKYTFNFSGINAMIAQDQIGRFYVSVSVNGSLDTNDATNANWALAFPDGGVQAVSPDGSVDTYNASSGNVGSIDLTTNTGFTFGKFSANGVKAEINLSSSNPSATVVTVQNTSATTGVTLLKFNVKATNSNLTLRKVPIQVIAGTDVVTDMINTIKLYRGTDLLDSLDGSAVCDLATVNDTTTAINPSDCTTINGTTGLGYLFSNIAAPNNLITSGTTAEFSVVVDLKQLTGNYDEGDTLTASLANVDALLTANLSMLDANGDQLTAGATYRVGSAVGNVMTVRVNGVNVVQGAAVITKISDNAGIITSITYDVPLAVSAFGQTSYVGQSVELAAAASGVTTAAKAFSFALQEAAAPSTDLVAAPAATAVTSTLSSSDALIEGNGFRIDSGTTKHFTMQVIVSCTAAACAGATTGNYRVHTVTARAATESTLAAPTNQTLLPNQSYQTAFQKIK